MKLTKTIAFALLASATFSSAATTLYTVTTGTAATSSGIANKDGLQFQSSSVAAFNSAGPGSIGFGYFNITDAAITGAASASTLVNAFVNWNTNGAVGFNAPGPTQQRGVFSDAAPAFDMTGTQFSGKNMYVFVGNAATFAGSDQFLVLKTTFIFDPAEFGPTAITKTITTANSSVLFGTQVANVFTTGTDASQTPGWNTAPVPEPSAALLGAIGALGLLRRRRN